MVSRVWRASGLAPHKQDSWKLSKDPLFVDKVRDIVGLYLNPPERAVVLCVDEKTQIQALNRTAPVFPMLPGAPARASHDYVRHGTSSLYAALDLATGKVIGSLHSRHRAQEFLAFLKKIDAEVPPDLDCHVVLDNASTHKTPQVKRWLTAHPRFVLHFTHPISSWLNRPRFYAHFLCWKDGAMSIRYDENTKARAVRLVREHRDDYESEWAAMKAISGRLGMNPETLRKWVRQTEIDAGEAPGVSSEERRELRELRRKNRELESTIEILKAATSFFARECDPRHR